MRRRSNSSGKRFTSYKDAVPAIQQLRTTLPHTVETMDQSTYNKYRQYVLSQTTTTTTTRDRDQECAATFEWPFVQSLKNRMAIMTQLEFDDGLHWVAVVGDTDTKNNEYAYDSFATHWKVGTTFNHKDWQLLSAYDTVLAMLFERVPRWAMRKIYKAVAYERSRKWVGRGWIVNSSLKPDDEDIIRWAWLDAEWVEQEVLNKARLAFVKNLDRWMFASTAFGRTCQSLDINKPCGFTIDLSKAPSDRDYQIQRARAESTLPPALLKNVREDRAFLFYDLDESKWCYLSLEPREVVLSAKRGFIASYFPRVWQRVTLWAQYVAV